MNGVGQTPFPPRLLLYGHHPAQDWWDEYAIWRGLGYIRPNVWDPHYSYDNRIMVHTCDTGHAFPFEVLQQNVLCDSVILSKTMNLVIYIL